MIVKVKDKSNQIKSNQIKEEEEEEEEEEEVPLFIMHSTSPYFLVLYFIPSPQSVVRSPCFILTAINSFMHITYYTTTR